jgi:hypothetical protein
VTTVTSLWRQAFNAFERPFAAAAESWVQSQPFMDLTATTVRVERQLTAEGQRWAERWLHVWGIPARGDVYASMNQVARLEHQVRDLRSEVRQQNVRHPGSNPEPTVPQYPETQNA